jgi:ATP-dependent Clp protease ATP-binding subunit ClpA
MTEFPSASQLPIFLDDGSLDRAYFDEGALEVLDACTTLLQAVGRSVYLPLDLMVALTERDHPELSAAVATAANGEEAADVAQSLRRLAMRVERRHLDPPALAQSHFSVGFAGILADALAWARECKRTAITEADIARVVRWRVELQESASVRWAVRELSQPEGDDGLFDGEGNLRRDNFDVITWNLLLRGVQLSARAGLGFLGTPHLMAAFCEMPDGVMPRAAQRGRVETLVLRDELMRIVGARSPAQPEFALHRRTLTPRLARMLGSALDSAARDSEAISEKHVAAAFLDDGGTALELLRSLGVHPLLNDALRAQGAPVGIGERRREGPPEYAPGSPAQPSATPTLDLLGRDLTAEARAGTLPEVHGRDAELQRIINVLMRSEQRNPLLTGEAGVGKTALAIALARRVADGLVPRRLADVRIVEISGASLVGGTSYRGELEARIRNLIAEAEQNVILFIDEAHSVFAPKTNSGQPAEVPNHFKAALAAGRIAVIAATTEAEYHRWIEQDPALRRRFERIEIPELSQQQTRAILQKLAPVFEREYEIPLTPDAVDAAIEYSVRFLPEQSLPDKAKKLLMDATISAAAEQTVRAVGTPESDAPGTPRVRVVCREDVARQITYKTGIPFDRVVRGPRGWWVGLEARLESHVVGQADAVERVCRSLVSGRLHGVGRHRPQGVFLFVGPPGVGKTELATAMAEEIFGNRNALLRLDMSDYAEAHSLSRLIGTPPGYVGYQDEDALVSPLRRRPSSLVVLADFDRAHPRVQERFLRLFADGAIADTRGLKADASHAIFVLTVERAVANRAGIGFGTTSAPAEPTAALAAVAPELAERIRGQGIEVIGFRGLTENQKLGVELFDDRFARFAAAVFTEFGIRVELPTRARTELAKRIVAMRDVREVEELFNREVIDPVTNELLAGATDKVLRIGRQKELA